MLASKVSKFMLANTNTWLLLRLQGSSSIVSLVNLADIASTVPEVHHVRNPPKAENEPDLSDENNMSEGEEDEDDTCLSGVQVVNFNFSFMITVCAVLGLFEGFIQKIYRFHKFSL